MILSKPLIGKLTIVIILLVTCVSCSTTTQPRLIKPSHLLRMSDTALREVDHVNLCRGYAKNKSKRIAQAINDLGFMNEKDWKALDSGQLYEGLAECVLFIGYEPANRCRNTVLEKGYVNRKTVWQCNAFFSFKAKILTTHHGRVLNIQEKPDAGVFKGLLPLMLEIGIYGLIN